jgi:pyridoxal phosphate enzyme (YggS family)
MNDIAHNLAQVRDKISAAAARCGRAPEEVTLLAVSKTKPASAIEEAMAAGQVAFGENYVQEGVEKIRYFQEKGATGLQWHFMGRCSPIKAVWWPSILTGAIPSIA